MNTRITVLPKTTLGRWSVGLAAVCIVLLILLLIRVVPERGSLGAMMLGFTWVISGIAALVIGLVSIIKAKERSILAFLAVVVMVLVNLFGLLMFIGEEVLG